MAIRSKGLDELIHVSDATLEQIADAASARQQFHRVLDLDMGLCGIHPAILSEGGLKPALKALARRSPVPVELDVGTDRRLPERVEVAA